MLNKLVSIVKKRKVVGRGGDRGGTSGKGGKGQNARSGGGVGITFEGGQMPLARRLPKRGFNNKAFRTEYEPVNVERLEQLFEAGAEITKEALVAKGCLKSADCRLKVLARGTLSKKFVVHADAFSQSAVEAIQKCGGEAHLIKER